MNPTTLTYLEDMNLLSLEAEVLAVEEDEGKTTIVLNRTIFYPQGGGQPFDQGYIRSASETFKVEEVRFVDGLVRHIGMFEHGSFKAGDTVQCEVDAETRLLHARLHSAGHVVDLALLEFPHIHWKPGKGYHFPQGPYVEYAGEIEEAGDIEVFKKELEDKANEIVKRADTVSIRFMPKEEMYTVCHSVPDYLPEGKPARVVMYGSAGIPCGGTHVSNLGTIGPITIRKVKKEKDAIRVSYSA